MLVITQIKENIKDNMLSCHHHIVRKYHKTHIFVYSNTLFFIIYCFKVCLFSIKEMVFLSHILAPFLNTDHPDIYSEHPGFFVTEVDCNIWNIVQFSTTYVQPTPAANI